MLPGMLGVFAEFETTLRRERQLEGIAKAKAAGIYKGRKPMVSADAIKALRAEGKGPHGDRKGPGHLEDECISSASAGRAEGQVGAFRHRKGLQWSGDEEDLAENRVAEQGPLLRR